MQSEQAALAFRRRLVFVLDIHLFAEVGSKGIRLVAPSMRQLPTKLEDEQSLRNLFACLAALVGYIYALEALHLYLSIEPLKFIFLQHVL